MKKNNRFCRLFSCLLPFFFLLLGFSSAMAQAEFITKWKVTAADKSITIPTKPGLNYNYTVDWGDGSPTTTHNAANPGGGTMPADATYTYAAAGTYTVTISGTFPAIYFDAHSSATVVRKNNAQKIIGIEQWGTGTWQGMERAFYGCGNLEGNFTDKPVFAPNCDLSLMFAQCSKFNSPLNNWDVSQVTNMRGMFAVAAAFNQPLNNWDVSQVTNMQQMFYKAKAFNQPLNNWDVSKVTDMGTMFRNATVFNQPIGNWSVSQVTNMGGMFDDATAFNQPLNNWDVSKVTDMSGMFASATAFNQPLNNWDVSNVTNMVWMFYAGAAFNRPLNSWNVSQVNNMFGMFQKASAFNQPLNNWDVSKVTNMVWMFKDATAFDQNIGGWNVSQVTNMQNMFYGATLSTANYDALLIGWNARSLKPNVNFHGGNSKYCAGEAARRNMQSSARWTIIDGGKKTACDDFITKWKVTAADKSITIPTKPRLNYNYTVNWGDGIITTHTAVNPEYGTMTANTTHTYAAAGTYTVTISGTFPAIYFNAHSSATVVRKNNAQKIISIEQWGTGTWQTMERAFWGCSNLEGNFTDKPTFAPNCSLAYMFRQCSKFNSPLNNWDVSQVTDMRGMFTLATTFNQPLNNWDVSKVTNMSEMFGSATAFDQNIGNWDVSKVTNMWRMFLDASAFNQPLNNWDVSQVTNMFEMFTLATTFNQPLNNWDVSQVTNMMNMFGSATTFNQSLNNWDVSKVTDMSHMFRDATSFNQPLNNWDVSQVTNMEGMFNYATVFNQPLNNWDVSQVTDMAWMFNYATVFNQPLNNWDVSQVTDMAWMFKDATAFNQSLNNWDVSQVTDMVRMFRNATAFDQNIGGWDVSQVTDMKEMFEGATLSTANYDALLIGWNARNLKPNVNFHGGNSKYCKADTARANMVSAKGDNWTITDGGKSCPPIISTLVPADNSTNASVSNDLVITFDKNVLKGTGNIKIYDASNTLFESIAVTDARITVSGAVVTISLTNNLAGNTAYYVQIDSTAFDDTSGNSFAGISDKTTWRFTTEKIPAAIAFANITKTYGDANFNLGATTNSGDTITYSIIGAANGTSLSGANKQTVRLGKVGTLTIRASVAATATHTAATKDITLTIGKKSLTATLTDTVTKAYDGNTAATLAANNYILTGKIGSDTVQVATTTGTYDNKNVGTNKTVRVGGLTLSGADAGNYSLAATNISGAVGTITKATLTVTADDKAKVYDGSIFPLADYTATYTGFASGETAAVLGGRLTFGGSSQTAIDNGTYEIIPGGLTATNYELTFKNGTLTIGKENLMGITFPGGSFVYDGRAKSLKISGDLPAGVSVSYSGNGKVDAGIYEVVAQIQGSGSNSRTLQATLRITPAKITGLSFADSVFRFDGSTKSLAVSGNLPTGASINYSGNGKTDAGIYEVAAQIEGGRNYQSDTLKAQLTIEKAQITGLSFANSVFRFDGSPKSLAISGNLPTGASIKYSGNGKTDAGIYEVVAQIEGGRNYQSDTMKAQLTIEKAKITGLSFADSVFRFDGSPKSLAVSGDLPSGATVRYIGNGKIDAGIYEVIAQIGGGRNYQSDTLKAQLTIEKAKIADVSLPDGSFVYNGAAQSLKISGDLPAGVSVNYSGNGKTDAGIYEVIAQIEGGKNYQSEALKAKLTIEKATQTLTWTQDIDNCSGEISFCLTAQSSSGLPVTYTSSDRNAAKVSGDKLQILKRADFRLTATQAGDKNHRTAEPMTKVFTQKLFSLVSKHWEDALFFDNSSRQFTAWQWYKNGELVVGATKQYYHESAALDGIYHAKVTDVSGAVRETCPLKVVPGKKPGGIVLSPNPVSPEAEFVLEANYPATELKGAKVQIISVGSQFSETKSIGQVSTTLNAPPVSGLYIVRLLLRNGKQASGNLLVR